MLILLQLINRYWRDNLKSLWSDTSSLSLLFSFYRHVFFLHTNLKTKWLQLKLYRSRLEKWIKIDLCVVFISEPLKATVKKNMSLFLFTVPPTIGHNSATPPKRTKTAYLANPYPNRKKRKLEHLHKDVRGSDCHSLVQDPQSSLWHQITCCICRKLLNS